MLVTCRSIVPLPQISNLCDFKNHNMKNIDLSNQWAFSPGSSPRQSSPPWQTSSLNIVDLLRTRPSRLSFQQRVQSLGLTSELESKILIVNSAYNAHSDSLKTLNLTENDEKELATEVLLYRHKFTTLVFHNSTFRQAAITVIQNGYIFKNRKIFFHSESLTSEMERQEALILFTGDPQKDTISINKTLQHVVLARIWSRIAQSEDGTGTNNQLFSNLSEVVERLNTIRNIYILLTTKLIKKITRNINKLYSHSITQEDACQIGAFGIARAAYRYHPSVGVRFSTYAAHWVQKEIQRQSLAGRLIRISSNLVEQYSLAKRENNEGQEILAKSLLETATEQLGMENDKYQHRVNALTQKCPSELTEQKECHDLLFEAINNILPEKSKNIIIRRYGLGQYYKKEQSVVTIAKEYGVTRSSIYQLEHSAIYKLKKYLEKKQYP